MGCVAYRLLLGFIVTCIIPASLLKPKASILEGCGFGG